MNQIQKLSQHYDDKFYAQQVDGSLKSARIILSLLYEYYSPATVLDIGCGRGAWLKAAEELGSGEITGIDGPWVDKDKLLSKAINFSPTDFEGEIIVDKRYGLCISLEVAEHLSASRAKGYIDTLCAASDVVLFSAAVIGQGGENHINEQWQTYWIKHFKKNSYACADVLRPKIWNNKEVKWWYRQNILIFYKKGANSEFETMPLAPAPIYDIAHPDNFEDKLKLIKLLEQKQQVPSFKYCLQCFFKVLKRKFNII